MQKITPFLWFNGRAEEAARYYVSIFKKSKIGDISRYGDHFPDKKGQVMTVSFKLEGQEFIALNGDSEFKFTPAISLFVLCKTQKEIDHIWKKLSAGGKEIQCGWVTDKFGITWQVVPDGLLKLIGDKNREKANRAMQEMMSQVKFDIAKLKRAHGGK
jgi:predicted 3-demethylubiquinone-9 3-methyltransferase (glyoxalase superfamily)